MKKKGVVETIKLNDIKDPSFLKSLDYKQLASLAKDIRKEIIEVTSNSGGHLSSNLGVVEITIALNRVFDFAKDKLILDVGHQCYAQKMLTGRKLEHLNERGYCNGFQNRAESPYDCYDAGHSSTSLSAAEAFAYVRDQKKENYDVVALIGDASIVNGLAFEGLNNIGERHNKVIVILNDNAMSINQPVGGMGRFFRKISTGKIYNKTKKGFQRAMSRSFFGKKIYNVTYRFKRALKYKLVPTTMFDNMGFTYVGPVDGHNIKSLEKAMNSAKNSTKSVVIHCRTVKGKGYPFAENDKAGNWHGVSPFCIETGKAKNPHNDEVSWPLFYGRLVKEALDENEDNILVTAATAVGSKLGEAFKAHPKRCIDVGIAEEHALTFSGALSLAGKRPIVSLYSTFLQRAYDEISHDCARMGSDMTLLIDRAGLSGKNGETHQGIYDVAFLRSIPNVLVTMPSDEESASWLFKKSFSQKGVFAIRYPNAFMKQGEKALGNMRLGFRLLWKSSDDAAFLCVGPKGKEFALKCQESDIKGSFIDPVVLSEVSKEDLKALMSYKKIFVYDPYSVKEGFGDMILSSLMEEGYKGQVKVRALPLKFIKFGCTSDQEKECLVDMEAVLAEAKAF